MLPGGRGRHIVLQVVARLRWEGLRVGLGASCCCLRAGQVSAARHLHPAVIEWLKAHPNTNSYHVFDNRFLLGANADVKFKLGPKMAVAALNALMDDPDKTITAVEFKNQICAPIKVAEDWQRQVRATYGKCADTFPAFARVCSMLISEQGRRLVNQCLKDKTPLHGTGADSAGIEECRVIVAELKKMKAGAPAGAPKSGEEAAEKDGGVTPSALAGQEGQDNAAEPSASSAGDDAQVQQDLGLSLLEGLTKAEPDPIMLRASTLLATEMLHVSTFTSAPDLVADIEQHVFASQRLLFVVDAPTSKIRVLIDMMKTVATILAKGPVQENFSLIMPVGSRLDVLSAMSMKLKELFPKPKHSAFAIQLSSSNVQTSRACPQYLLFVSGPNDVGKAASALNVSGCYAKPFEGLRLRCTDPLCPMRPEEERKRAQEQLDAESNNMEMRPDAEIHADDCEGNEGGEDYEEQDNDAEEDEIMAALQEDDEPTAAGGKSKYLVELFTFGRPVSFYTKVLAQIGQASQADHLIVITRTAHPAILVAGRQQKLSVHALVSGCGAHQVAHGQKLLKTMLYRQVWSEAKRTTTAPKRVRSTMLSFIEVEAPPAKEQIVRLSDCAPSESSSWRAGFNNFPADLETLTIKLAQSQLEASSLTIKIQEGGSRVLTASRHLREGESVCPVSALWFNDARSLEAVLTANKYLADRVVRISGVLGSGESEGGVSPSMQVFGVLVGAARHVSHYAGVRKGGPNCALAVDLTSGPGDELLRLVVTTRNKQGISAGQPIALNFGLGYDASAVEEFMQADAPSSKKYRGALDVLFQVMDKDKDAESEANDNAEKPETKPGTKPEGKPEAKPEGNIEGKPASKQPEGKAESKADSKQPEGQPDVGSGAKPAKPWAPDTVIAEGSDQNSSWGALCCVPAAGGMGAPVIRLYANPSAETNKRVAPGTVLATITQGEISMKGSSKGGMPYALQGVAKKVHAYLATDKAKPPTLSSFKNVEELLVDTGAKEIARHSLVKGTGKQQIKPAEGLSMRFQARSSKENSVLEACANLQGIEGRWVLRTQKVGDNLCLTPMGVALAITKQIIVPAGGSVQIA